MFFCDDNLSKESFKCVEYSRTFQIASRFASTVVIFSVINTESRATPGMIPTAPLATAMTNTTLFVTFVPHVHCAQRSLLSEHHAKLGNLSVPVPSVRSGL